jgi:hypothetical protein
MSMNFKTLPIGSVIHYIYLEGQVKLYGVEETSGVPAGTVWMLALDFDKAR